MENDFNQKELVEKYFLQIDKKIKKLICKSFRYNLIDRLFFFLIEENKIRKKYFSKMHAPKFTKQSYSDVLSYIEGEIFVKLTYELIHKIRKCYGLNSIKTLINSETIIFLNNPILLGISPFLLDQNDWSKVIFEELKKSKFKFKDMDFVVEIIENSFSETVERTGFGNFVELRKKFFDNYWREDFTIETNVFSLMNNSGYYEESEKIALIEEQEEREKEFLKSKMFNDSLQSKIKMNYKFEVIDSIFKKYFEMSISKDKWASVYSNFNYYLKIIMNLRQIEKKEIIVEISKKEIKGLIYLFGFLKYENVLIFKNSELFSFLQIITGLKQTDTWENYLKPTKNKLDSKIKTEINSLIPENPQI